MPEEITEQIDPELESAFSGEPVAEPSAGGNEQMQQPDGQPSVQPADPQQQAPAGSEPVWDGTKWTLKYRGQNHIPKSRDELIGLAQRGFSYNNEMQRFNQERETFKTQIDDLTGRMKQYEQFDNMLKTNPALGERITQLFQQFEAGGGLGEGEQQSVAIPNQIVNDLMNRIKTLETTNSEFTTERYDKRLEQSLSELRSKYPDNDWDRDDGTGNLETHLLQFALDNGITDLGMAYRAMMFDSVGVNAQADALKRSAENRQAATRAGVVQSGAPSGGAAVPKTGYRYGDSYNDLARRMTNEMK